MMNAISFPINKGIKYSQKQKAIKVLNQNIEAINAIIESPESKLSPLKKNATEDEIKATQDQIKVFAEAYEEILVGEIINSNPEISALTSVKVGDIYQNPKTGVNVAVISRNDNKTIVNVTNDKGMNVKREYSNSEVDNIITNPDYVQVGYFDENDTDTTEDIKEPTAPSTTDTIIENEFNSNAQEMIEYQESLKGDTSTPKKINLTQVGDFYEAYGDDAVELAEKLNLQLTSKTINRQKVQMVGFPVHVFDKYKSALGSNYNLTVSSTPTITSINSENMHVTDAETAENADIMNTDVDSSRKRFVAIISENIKNIKNNGKIFEVDKDIITQRDGKNLTEKIYNYFKSIGSVVKNKIIGDVELTKSGAKSTVFHGMGKNKVLCIPAIKDVIERGKILQHDNNWKERGYDTYIFAGYGELKGVPSIIGIIVKAYPNSNIKNKFYIHEVIKIGAEADTVAKDGTTNVIATTPSAAVQSQVPNDNNVIPQPTSETPLNSSSASTDIISENTKNVNTQTDESSNTTENAENADIMNTDVSNSTLITDFEGAVDDVLTDSDETARQKAENRVAIQILKDTPDIILDNVAESNNLPVIINYTKLYLAARENGVIKGHYHNFGQKIKLLPNFLQNPDMILKMDNGRINLITALDTNSENSNLVSVELNSEKIVNNRVNSYNVVVTVFAPTDNYLNNIIHNSKNEIVYRKRGFTASESPAVQYPAIVNDKSSSINNSISQNDTTVNNSIRKNGEIRISEPSEIYNDVFYGTDGREIILTKDEKNAILKYKSSEAFEINKKLRAKISLNETEQNIVTGVNSALDKFPVYKGIVYRNIGFPRKKFFNDFAERYSSAYRNGNGITENAFTSSSKSATGYTVDEAPYKAHFILWSVNGKDVSNLGLAEEYEVLFKSPTEFDITSVEIRGNEIFIKGTERAENGNTANNNRRNVEKVGEIADKQETYGRERGTDWQVGVREGSTVDTGIPTEQSDSNDRGTGQRGISDNSASNEGNGNVTVSEREVVSGDITATKIDGNKIYIEGTERIENGDTTNNNRRNVEKVGEIADKQETYGRERGTTGQTSSITDVFAVSPKAVEHFSNQISEWRNGNMKKSEMFDLGDTPFVLKSLGADDLSVVMTQKVMGKITGGKHNIAVDTIKNIPQAITDPVMVFNSDTVDNAFVILTELTDVNGKDVIVAMHLSRGDKHNNINRISSVYGKENIKNFVTTQIRKGNLRYIDNKKSRLWSQSRGLQLPKLADTNSGFTNSILQKENLVNTNSMQDSKNYTSERGNIDEQRNDLLFGNSGRTDNASAGEQAGKLQAFKRENQGKTEAERKRAAKELFAKGQTRQEIIRTKKGAIRINSINANSYDADMQSVADSFKEDGVETILFVGRGERAFDSGKKISIDGFVIGNKVYLRYDGKTAPQMLKLHEMVHFKWNTPQMQAVRESILGNITKEEKSSILSEQRYLDYADVYGDDVDIILEEFVADTLAGMSDYTMDYIDIVTDYWNNDVKDIDNYKVAEYTESIDAGGKNFISNEDIPYREKRQLEDYILQKNHSATKLKVVDCKEIGDNFYIWNNKTKTDFKIEIAIPIEGNEDLIYDLRRKMFNGTYRTTGGVDRRTDLQRIGRRRNNSNNAMRKGGSKAGGVGRLSFGQSAGNEGGYIEESSGDKKDSNKGVILKDDVERDNINDRISRIGKEVSGSGFAESLHRNAGRGIRGIQEIVGNAGNEGTSGVSETDIRFALPQKGEFALSDFFRGNYTDEELRVYAKELNKQLVQEHGAIKKGENPTRDIDVPKKIAKDKPVSQFARTMMEAGITPDSDDISSKIEEYSYEALINKPDMEVAKLDDDNLYTEEGKLDRAGVIARGIENVRSKNNSKNTDINSFVYVPDIGGDVLVTKPNLRHGLSRNAEATAKVTLKIGDILENSIVINEINARGNTGGGYVLLGIAIDEKGRYYPVRMVVNNYSVDSVEVLDVLYAINAKRRTRSETAQGLTDKTAPLSIGSSLEKNQSPNGAELPANAVPPIKGSSWGRTSLQTEQGIADKSTPLIKGSSKISVADLLEIVKNDFSDVLSNDVLSSLGVARKKSSLSDSIKYYAEEADVISEFEMQILNGTMTHEVITNKKAAQYATDRIKYLGFEEAMKEWESLSRAGKVGKKELALGMELYNQCVTNKDVRLAMKIAAELAAEATRAGQTLQATRMLKQMTPDGQLYYIEKSLEKMNDEFREKFGDRYKDITPDEKIVEDFLSAKDESKRNEAYDRLCQNIADQIPATFIDKWNSWRYLAMLGNPRTHIRNIVGNAVFLPAVRINNYVAATLEKIAKVDKSKRMHSFTKSKEAIEFAKKDFDSMSKVLQGENAKYAVTSDIEGKRAIFQTKALEKLRLTNFKWLEAEDMIFLKVHYVDALARIITARGIDVKTASPDVLNKARAYAVKEAQAATYRDANALAEALNKIQKRASFNENKAVRASSVLIEGVMPFKKTPLNIAKQGINYSPIGLLNGILKTFKKFRNGESYSASEVIDTLSKGITGTALLLLGYFLASMGLVGGSEDENKKKKNFDEMLGEQEYAIRIGDSSYTIDWMTPVCLPLFIGVELNRLTENEFSFGKVVEAVSNLTDPLLELSVFSGLSSTIESAQYSDTNEIFAIGSDMVSNYFTQAFPTIGGQLSRMIDNTEREYYFIDKNSDVPKALQSFIGQAASKIPFASYLFAPQVDEWGREKTYGPAVERAIENTVSPGYYSKANYTAVDKELLRLYEKTGETSVLPTTQQKYYVEDKVYYYMSAKDYAEVKKIRGQKAFELVQNYINSSEYKRSNDEERVKKITNLYKDAGTYAKGIMLEQVKNNAG